MNYKIKYISVFAKELKRLGKKYRSMSQDYARLIEELHANPQAGVSLGGGVRKVRMAIASKNKGKSHGARVITFTYSVDEETGTIVCCICTIKKSAKTYRQPKSPVSLNK